MCEMMLESEHKNNNKEHQLKHILSENLRMIPEKDEVDKYGPGLYIGEDDDHLLHIKEHNAFITNNTLKPQYKSKLEMHIKKHDIAYAEQERMGIKKGKHNSKSEEEEY